MTSGGPTGGHGITGTVVLRPGSSGWLAAAGGLVCVVGLVNLVSEGTASDVLRFGPLLVLGGLAAWAVFWRPAVVVSDGGVELRNVFRTVHVPWPALQAVETRYAMVLHTAEGRFTAWAAPAPGNPNMSATHVGALKGLPRPANVVGEARASDLPTAASGQAAAVVRLRWAALREAGHLDDPRLEGARPRVRWHRATILAAAGLVTWAVAASAVLR